MAKTFGGFTPQQQQTLLSKMGYTGPAQQDDMNKFMMSSPKAASMMGKYAEMAKARVEGGPQMAMQEGGIVVGKGGKYYIKDAQGGYSQPYNTALDAYYANKGQTTNTATGATIQPYAGTQPQLPTKPIQSTTRPVETGDTTIRTPDMRMPSQPVIDTPGYGQPTLPVEPPTYDPSQGLPTSPENMYTDAGSAIDAALEGQDFNNNDTSWAKTTAQTLTEVADPSKYQLRKDGNYYTIVYDDGTEVKTGYRYENQAQGRADALNVAIPAAKNVVTEEEKTAAEQIYQQQLDQYKQYQSGTAETTTDAPVYETVDAAQRQVSVSQNLIQQYNNELAGLEPDDPRRSVLEEFIADENIKLNQANAGLTQAQQRAAAERQQQRQEAMSDFEADPSGQVARADVATVSGAQREAGSIAAGTGQAGTAATADTVKAAIAGDVKEPERKEAATYTAEETAARIQDTLDKLVATTGKPAEDALAEAQTMDATQLSQLGLTAAQIEEATQVQAPQLRTVQEGEMIEGSTVDMGRLEAEALNFEAATGTPSTDATVAGQLTKLQEQFEGGQVPSWAAGAIRAANATMAARGLGASSMAGQAVLQAAMESAMPIAMADAQTVAQFEAQNLSNRQQTAMLKAEQRAKFLGIEFDQEFQTRVQNAARIADIANQNFNAEVQISLENARLANSVDLANLDAKNAKLLADAAAMSQVELANLNNRQEAAVQRANAFLQFDMKEFDAKQQVAMFKTEGVIQSILSDSAAVNAAAQFNATSENQTNQFYDSLISQVQQFNVDQKNAMEKFNAEQANAVSMFNKEQANRRAEFNASQALVVEQANAKWAQDIALAETAAINQANRDAAKAENEMTMAAYEAQVQQERDAMSYAFQTANNNADRATQIAIETMRQEASADEAAASKSAALATAVGAVVANIVA